MATCAHWSLLMAYHPYGCIFCMWHQLPIMQTTTPQRRDRCELCHTGISHGSNESWWLELPSIKYLGNRRLTGEATVTQRQQINIRNKSYLLEEDKTLMKEGPDGIQRKCMVGSLTTVIIAEAYERVAGGHFSANLTLHKIRTTLYWWPTMKKYVYLYC